MCFFNLKRENNILNLRKNNKISKLEEILKNKQDNVNKLKSYYINIENN